MLRSTTSIYIPIEIGRHGHGLAGESDSPVLSEVVKIHMRGSLERLNLIRTRGIQHQGKRWWGIKEKSGDTGTQGGNLLRSIESLSV